MKIFNECIAKAIPNSNQRTILDIHVAYWIVGDDIKKVPMKLNSTIIVTCT